MRFRRDGRGFASAVKIWYASLKKSHQIAVWVLIAHFAALFWMGIDHLIAPKPKNRHPIFVRSIEPIREPIRIETPRLAATASPEKAPIPPATQKAPASKPAPAQAPAKTVQKRAVAKKESPALRSNTIKKDAPPKGPAVPRQAIQEIEKSLSALSGPVEKIPRKSSPDVALPSILESHSTVLADIEVSPETAEIASNYSLSLIEMLQRSLQLPEVGEVLIKIQLANPGKLMTVQILDSKSSKNAEWLKNQLPLLELPCFNDYGIVDAFLEFTIMFRNVENS
jgi:hypothetical protein